MELRRAHFVLSVHALEAALHAVLGGSERNRCGRVEGEGGEPHADSEMVEINEEAVEGSSAIWE